ncbi:MAG: hypothetical protein LBC64_07335 [Fibromonadaceae bacterium]|jgi:hypothetical protein|nr:hypothetical protein [Fibromonadaceae bacterium]
MDIASHFLSLSIILSVLASSPKVRNKIWKGLDLDKTSNVEKQRHGFLTFWLIFTLVVYIIAIIGFVYILSDKNMLKEMEMSIKDTIGYIELFIIECLSCILLLKWKIEGFILSCLVSIATIVIDPNISSIAFAIIGLVWIYALLQLKKNDISAWTHLTGKYSKLDNIASVASTNESKSQEEYKKCPFCAESIKKAATVCRFCQRNVE